MSHGFYDLAWKAPIPINNHLSFAVHPRQVSVAVMASRAFFDPINLLRLAPLVTSTCTLMYAFDEYMFLSTFLHRDHRKQSNAILPSWFKRWFEKGIFVVVGLNAATIIITLFNIFSAYNQEIRKWYWAGLGFTIAHLAFVPVIMYPIRDIIEDRSHGQSTRDLQRWINIHLLRVLIADLPGWASYSAGVVAMMGFQGQT